jgi:acetylornithine deacetylase
MRVDSELPTPFADQLVPLLEELVAVDSINPSLVPNAAGEAALARLVADWFSKRGIEPRVEDVASGRPNVIAVAHGRGHGRSIILNAHLDTVGVAGMDEPFSAAIKGRRLYGRGAMDTKGGLAAFMIATAAAAKRPLKGDVIFAGVVDEEFASLGTESILGRVRADAAIVAEPTGLEIQTCHKGFMWLEVETAGVAAHGSRFEQGVDAIVKMGKFLVALEELGRRLESRPGHPLLGPASVHASIITGGQELSSYPASCRVSVERRTLPNETHGSVQAEFQELLDRLRAEDPNFTASCRTTFSREPLDVSTQSDIVEILGKQVHRHLGHEAVISGSSGWTDAALLSTNGIPSIIFGPSGEGLHALLEWVDLESVRQCCSIVLAAITEFCGG